MPKCKVLKGYKVVSESRSGNLLSAVGVIINVTYSTKNFVRPPKGCGPLTCFSTRKAARIFRRGIGKKDVQIWKCYYSKSKHERLWVGDSSVSKTTLIRQNSEILEEDTVVFASRIKLRRFAMFECGIKDCLHESRKRALQCDRMKIELTNIDKLNKRVEDLSDLLHEMRIARDEVHEELNEEKAKANQAIKEKTVAEEALKQEKMSLDGANGQSKALEEKLNRLRTELADTAEYAKTLNVALGEVVRERDKLHIAMIPDEETEELDGPYSCTGPIEETRDDSSAEEREALEDVDDLRTWGGAEISVDNSAEEDEALDEAIEDHLAARQKKEKDINEAIADHVNNPNDE